MRLRSRPQAIRRAERRAIVAALLSPFARAWAYTGKERAPAARLSAGRSAVEIKIHLPQQKMTIGEQPAVDVELVNNGAVPLTVPALNDPYAPEPHFVLSGGGLTEPQRFHWSGRAPRGTTEHAPRETATIAPGESLRGQLHLPPTLPVQQEGEYTLYAMYTQNGETAESNHARLQVSAARYAVMRLVGRTPMESLLGIQALAVNGSTMLLANFSEVRPEIGETKFDGVTTLFEVPPEATDHFAPWCQTAELGPVTPRFGWRTGKRVTVAGFGKLPQALELPLMAPHVYGPSLMNAKGDIDVFATEADGKTIALLHFPQAAYNVQPPAASVAWTEPIAEQPVTAMKASINPAGQKAAVLVRQGPVASLLQWDEHGPVVGPPVRLDGTPVPQVAPAFHIAASGAMRATILLRPSGSSENGPVILMELRWPAGGNGMPAISKSAPITLPTAIKSGSVAYSMSAIETPRREWFFILADGKVLSSRMQGKAKATKLQIPEPPQLAIMSAAAYCLVVADKPKLTMLQ